MHSIKCSVVVVLYSEFGISLKFKFPHFYFQNIKTKRAATFHPAFILQDIITKRLEIKILTVYRN